VRTRQRAVAFRCRVRTPELYRTSQLLSHLTGIFPQPNKAVVGRNAFAHEAGIHQHGMIKNGLTYEIIRPEEVGVPRSTLVLGKHSGRHALERRYQQLGYEPDEATLDNVYEAFTALADKKREILDEDLLALLHGRFHDAPEAYRLGALEVRCGTVAASAEVTLAGPWGRTERRATGSGNGPIAAAFAAVGEIVERDIEVLNLAVQSVTPGRDSLGQVLVQVRVDGKTLSGHGASTDIVEASTRALVHALNKASHADALEDQSLNAAYYWGV
jgi:2-isopropylmalate synthase